MNEGFEYEEVTEYGKSMIKAANEFPKVAERFMKNESRTLDRRMIKKAKSVLSEKTYSHSGKSYMEYFKPGKKVYSWSDAEFNICNYNNAPHAHLIEFGHRIVAKDGKDTGHFVSGKHIIGDSLIEYQREFNKHIDDQLADKILKEIEK